MDQIVDVYKKNVQGLNVLMVEDVFEMERHLSVPVLMDIAEIIVN
jgi:hypothetical protein